jgi:hypothetical protein
MDWFNQGDPAQALIQLVATGVEEEFSIPVPQGEFG